jgi:hypothetical protein
LTCTWTEWLVNPGSIEIYTLATCATPSRSTGDIEWSNGFPELGVLVVLSASVACGVAAGMVHANGVPIRTITMFGANRVIPRGAARTASLI